MSKELDYLDDILKNEPLTLNKRMIIECIKEKIQRLESTDSANPSEALECLEWVIKNYIGNDYYVYEEELVTIKQYILKSQEQEKVLEIIVKKEVSIFQLKCCKNVNEYNDLQFKKDKNLTEKEFELLKRYFNE